MTYGPDRRRMRFAIVLITITCATFAVAAGSFWVQRSITGEKTLTGKVLPDFAADMPQVRTISITTNRGTYNLVREANQWVMPERGNYPVASSKLAAFAKGLTDLSFKALRTSDPSQFARLGVDDPSPTSNGIVVSLKGSSNQLLASLHIGQKEDALFVRKSGSNDVFEADGALEDVRIPASWLDLSVLDVPPESIASVTGQKAKEQSYEIVRRPDGGFAPVGGQANVTATTAAIALTKWAPIDVMPANRLTSDPIANHTTTLKSATVISVSAYTQDGRNWVTLSATSFDDRPDEAVTKINKSTDGWAFELGPTEFADLTFARSAVVNGPQSAQPE